MRDYDLHIAETSDELPGQGLLIRLWRNWVARRAIASLRELDDHVLKDIGVERRDIEAAAMAPLSLSPIRLLKTTRQPVALVLPECCAAA